MHQRILFLFLFTSPLLYSQTQKGIIVPSKGLIDSAYGIIKYEKLNFSLGGDSVRYDKKGYSVQGWWEDYYENGTVLHKGYYADGQLKNYKNFYQNGHLERSFRQTNIGRSEMLLYYDTDTLKSKISYVGDAVQKEEDYYPSGKLSFIEEYDRKLEKLYQRKFFNEDGSPQSIIEIIDEKKQIYIQKEYYENGILKEDGKVLLSGVAGDFQKHGDWKYFDEKGKLIREESWNKGELSAEKKY